MCGVLGVFSDRLEQLVDGNTTFSLAMHTNDFLHDRGVDAHSFSFINTKTGNIHTERESGTIQAHHLPKYWAKHQKVDSNLILGQTKYTTSHHGEENISILLKNTQPIRFFLDGTHLSLVSNGNYTPEHLAPLDTIITDLLNTPAGERFNHAESLEAENLWREHSYNATVDTYTLAKHLFLEQLNGKDLIEAITEQKLHPGAQASILYVGNRNQEVNGTLYAYTDSHGIRPLSLAKWQKYDEQGIILTSETSVFNKLIVNDPHLEITDVQHVPNDSVLVFKTPYLADMERHVVTRLTRKTMYPPRRKISTEALRTPCFFEQTYFSKKESATSKIKLGNDSFRRGLAGRFFKRYTSQLTDVDVVTSSPRSGDSFSQRLGMCVHEQNPQAEFRDLVRKLDDSNLNKAGRQFIMQDDEDRKGLRVIDHLVLSELSERKGHAPHVLIGDDSLVRGNTVLGLYMSLRRGGAGKVTFAFSMPPVFYGCPYGIDIENPEELFATKVIPYLTSLQKIDMGVSYDQDEFNRIATDILRKDIKTEIEKLIEDEIKHAQDPSATAVRLRSLYNPIDLEILYTPIVDLEDNMYDSGQPSSCRHCLNGVKPEWRYDITLAAQAE